MVEGNGEALAWFEQLVADIRHCHSMVLETSGGAAGEHTDRLFASCARPFQSALVESLFGGYFARAAALFHGIISSHAFVDGNKRTATIALILFLAARGVITDAPSEVEIRLLGEIAVLTAASRLNVEDVTRWLHRILDP
jgi:death-on-curing protein